jgi:acyl-CoA thioesterase FadM
VPCENKRIESTGIFIPFTIKPILMRMYGRLFTIILAALLRDKNMTLAEESILRFLISPWDCVVKLAGNDRYHAFMDLGRIDLMIRLGGWHTLLSERLQPFVHTAHIRYRYPLRMFQGFILKTRLAHTDSSFFVMEHIFQSGPTVMATAISKNGMTYKGRIVPTKDILGHIEGSGLPYSEKNISVLQAVEKLLRGLQTI